MLELQIYINKLLYYRACGPFTKNKERIQKVREIGDSIYIYQNGLDKSCF